MKLDPVRIEGFFTSDTVSCNRRVQWQRLDTGHCPVEYNIEFKDNCGKILGNITDIRNNVSFYCTDDYDDSYSVTMWAFRNGLRGAKSQVAVLITTPKTVLSNAKGNHVVLNLFVFLSFFFFFIFFFLKDFIEKDLPLYCKKAINRTAKNGQSF